MSELSEVLELVEWEEDINKSKNRYDRALKEFSGLSIEVSKSSLTILEVAGGTGIGGIALSKNLLSKGFKVRLIITDLRPKALEKAKEFSRDELGFEAETYVIDAREIHKLGIKADIILMYGNSHATFSTFDMAKFILSSKLSLNSGGSLIIQGHNMFYDYIITSGYKEILPERVRKDKILLSIHEGYDEYRGMFKRLYIDLISGRKAEIELKYWDFGELIGLCKIFFSNVDLKMVEGHRGFVICSNTIEDVTSILT